MTFSNGAGDWMGGEWGAGFVPESAVKAGDEEATGEVGSHKGRREWFCWARYDLMSVNRSKISGSRILQSATCSFSFPWTAASLLARRVVGW